MIEALRKFIRNTLDTQDSQPQSEEEQIKIATAALLIQVSGADNNESGDEQQVIFQRICKLLSLTPEESRALYLQAQKVTDQSVSLYEFTRSLKALEYSQRYDFVHALWQVAYADGILDPQEEALIRKIADLVYLDHKDFIQAKLAAQPN
ncbi:TerB family tellurite resistance protein [Celerinatantimonas sp. YJH-8]|uniref:tellurite resistance TerB family protein n=1 Tax=Celerinatantimonas sp. YJH-8 TaxID=3228714 RepID=UPI0038BFBBF8